MTMNHSSQLRATIEIQHHRDETGESNEKEGSEDCDTSNDEERRLQHWNQKNQ